MNRQCTDERGKKFPEGAAQMTMMLKIKWITKEGQTSVTHTKQATGVKEFELREHGATADVTFETTHNEFPDDVKEIDEIRVSYESDSITPLTSPSWDLVWKYKEQK